MEQCGRRRRCKQQVSARVSLTLLFFAGTSPPPVQVLPPFKPQQLPASFNWAGKATSPVYNQGQCGSCWAFSATEQIESMTFLQRKLSTVPQYSMQQIVSCDSIDGVEGCMGGWTQVCARGDLRARRV